MKSQAAKIEKQGIQIAVGIILDNGDIAQMTSFDDRLQIGNFTAQDMINLIAVFRDIADALEDELGRITN
ncbi:MAG: hypothetical protein ACRCTL_10995 [Pseudomonas sp.]